MYSLTEKLELSDDTNLLPDPVLTVLISEVTFIWNHFAAIAQATILYDTMENQTFKITVISPRGQWVNTLGM